MTTFDITQIDQLLSTTRAVRKRLDLSRPVEPAVLRQCLELALQAPTGSNRQGWRWLIITDADKRKSLADLYRSGADNYLVDAHRQAQADGANEDARVFDSAMYLAEHLQRVPVHIIPCIHNRIGGTGPASSWSGLYGSIYPAVWSFQLALRARGLGSCITTLHLRHADEAAKLLGIPDDYTQVALLPVAYTLGTNFKPAGRRDLAQVSYENSWDAPWSAATASSDR